MDFVERLRGIGDPWCKAAAAEIERLQAELTKWQKLAGQEFQNDYQGERKLLLMEQHAEAAKQERDRLRKLLCAIHQIADAAPEINMGNYDDAMNEVWRIARQALAEDSDDVNA